MLAVARIDLSVFANKSRLNAVSTRCKGKSYHHFFGVLHIFSYVCVCSCRVLLCFLSSRFIVFSHIFPQFCWESSLIAAVNLTFSLSLSCTNTHTETIKIKLRFFDCHCWCCYLLKWFSVVVELKFDFSYEIFIEQFISLLYWSHRLEAPNTGLLKMLRKSCLFAHQIVNINFQMIEVNWQPKDEKEREREKRTICV